MLTSNPFAELSASVPPAVMQTYVVIMAALVVAGTLIDIIHKGSAKYFFENWRQSKKKGSKQVGGGEMNLATSCVVNISSSEGASDSCSSRSVTV